MKTAILIATMLVLAGCGNVDQNNFVADAAEDSKYLVIVTSISGAPVPGAIVCLDYDAGFTYAPPKFRTDLSGKVSIPHRYAEKFHYDWISVEGRVAGRELKTDPIWRKDVRWPLCVVLGKGE